MKRLKSRERHIPNGFVFKFPQLPMWLPNKGSFTYLCDQVEKVIKGNRRLAQVHRWPQDRPAIEAMVEAYNVAQCQAMGWNDYITEDGLPEPPPPPPSEAPPKSKPQHLKPESAAANGSLADSILALSTGAETIHDWQRTGWHTVPHGTAESRALICMDCPQNGTGNFTKWFTLPAANHIHRHLNKLHEGGISTPWDSYLGICEACLCPLKAKVWCPLDIIQKHATAEGLARLDKRCWILRKNDNRPL